VSLDLTLLAPKPKCCAQCDGSCRWTRCKCVRFRLFRLRPIPITPAPRKLSPCLLNHLPPIPCPAPSPPFYFRLV